MNAVGKPVVSRTFIQTGNSAGYFELSEMKISPKTSTLTRGVMPAMHIMQVFTISSPFIKMMFVMWGWVRDSLTKVARNSADFLRAPVSGSVMPFKAVEGKVVTFLVILECQWSHHSR